MWQGEAMIVCTKKAVDQLGTKVAIQLPSAFDRLLSSKNAIGLTKDEKKEICNLIAERLAANLKKYPLEMGAKVETDAGYAKTVKNAKLGFADIGGISIHVYTETIGEERGDHILCLGFTGTKTYKIQDLPKFLCDLEINIRDKYWAAAIDDVMRLLWKNAGLKGVPRYHTVEVDDRSTGYHGLPDVAIKIYCESSKIFVRTRFFPSHIGNSETFQLSEIMAAINYAFSEVKKVEEYGRTMRIPDPKKEFAGNVMRAIGALPPD